ncbi:MAG: helix-hairpin-helix domain-containing protein [Candidatus Omnitrophota bacterium]|nr:helix-hairpin-helix domain-containing protein [Candidatus Omnitrophota bacterium]
MLNFTQEERKVILFLVMLAFLGAGVNFAVKRFGGGKSTFCFADDLGKVNLNSADKRLLMKVSGIGEKLAQRIIDYRDKSRGFNALDELKEIEGMNDSKFAKLKDYLMVK